MSRAILCGLDGSPESRAALEVAAELSKRLGSRLVLAHVAEVVHLPYASAYPLGGTTGPTAVSSEIDAEEEAGRRLLERTASAARVVDAEHRVEVGVPAERLADLADEEDAELIVVGSRGRGLVKAAFLGSVSNSLVGVARCPVVVVPAGVTGCEEAEDAQTAQDVRRAYVSTLTGHK